VRISRTSVLAAATVAALVGAIPASAATQPLRPAAGAAAARQAGHSAHLAADVRSLPRDECSTAYFRGDSRLGPAQLPTGGAVGAELAGYRRTGRLPARRFLATYYDPTANSGQGGWIYPPDNGYVTGPGGQPEEAQLQLQSGQDIDRFGSEYGAFLGPAGLPYSARSIPPQNLDGTPAAGCNYHGYRVTKPFNVEAGPIAPWFGQPGGGTQFQLVAILVPGAPGSLNVMWLVNNGYLTRLP
jgi:Tuberculosis necrotizing toxin